MFVCVCGLCVSADGDGGGGGGARYWASIPVGTPFIVFDDPDNMDADKARVGRFMGITSAPGAARMYVKRSTLSLTSFVRH